MRNIFQGFHLGSGGSEVHGGPEATPQVQFINMLIANITNDLSRVELVQLQGEGRTSPFPSTASPSDLHTSHSPARSSVHLTPPPPATPTPQKPRMAPYVATSPSSSLGLTTPSPHRSYRPSEAGSSKSPSPEVRTDAPYSPSSPSFRPVLPLTVGRPPAAGSWRTSSIEGQSVPELQDGRKQSLVRSIFFQDFRSGAAQPAPRRRTGGKQYPQGSAQCDLNSVEWKESLINYAAKKVIKKDAQAEVEKIRQEAKQERERKRQEIEINKTRKEAEKRIVEDNKKAEAMEKKMRKEVEGVERKRRKEAEEAGKRRIKEAEAADRKRSKEVQVAEKKREKEVEAAKTKRHKLAEYIEEKGGMEEEGPSSSTQEVAASEIREEKKKLSTGLPPHLVNMVSYVRTRRSKSSRAVKSEKEGRSQEKKEAKYLVNDFLSS